MEIDFSSYKNSLSCFVGNSAPVNPIFTDEEAMVWMVGRVEKAEAAKESLINVLSQFVEAYHKGLIGAVPDVPPSFVLDSPGHPPSPFITRNLLEEMVRKAESALRTAEESSVVGLIDSTPAKQQEDSANADGDGEEVAIKNSSGGVFYVHPCKCGSKNLWYAKKDVLVDDSYEIMCNDCEFHVTSDTRQGVIGEWNRRVTK